MNSREFPGSTSQGQKFLAGGRRAGMEARRRQAEAEARRRWPASSERRAGEAPSPRRDAARRCGRAGVAGRGMCACVIRAFFSSKKFWQIDTVAFSFVFDKYCSIMD